MGNCSLFSRDSPSGNQTWPWETPPFYRKFFPYKTLEYWTHLSIDGFLDDSPITFSISHLEWAKKIWENRWFIMVYLQFIDDLPMFSHDLPIILKWFPHDILTMSWGHLLPHLARATESPSKPSKRLRPAAKPGGRRRSCPAAPLCPDRLPRFRMPNGAKKPGRSWRKEKKQQNSIKMRSSWHD